MKAFLSSLGSLIGASVDVLPVWARMALAFYLALCCCIVIGLHVLRDIRRFRKGE